MENNEQYYELRASLRRDIKQSNGWILKDVVDTEVFYSPETTHALYKVSNELPSFTVGEAAYRRERFQQAGFRSIGGVVGKKEMTIAQGIYNHEKGRLFLGQGALLGPYFLGGELVNGFRFYKPERDS